MSAQLEKYHIKNRFVVFLLVLFQIKAAILFAGTNFEIKANVSEDSAYSVSTADIDQDGHIDIVAALNPLGQIVWYKNNGTGVFGTAQIISSEAKKVQFIYIIDINNDDYPDVLAALYGSDSTPGAIILYKNGGNGFETETIDNKDCDGAQGVYSADMDGDGDSDIISASQDSVKIAWYENTGTDIKHDSLKFPNAHCVIAADIDGINGPDIIASSKTNDNIVWFKNNGDKSFGPDAKLISTEAFGSTSLLAMDLSGDSRLDIVSASGGTGGTERVHYTDEDGIVHYIDGEAAGQNIEWFENTISEDKFESKKIIAPDVKGSNNILITANINNDVIDDLVYTSLPDGTDGSIFFCTGKEKGNEPFHESRLICDNAGSVRGIAAADFDGDGDDDIVSASYAHYSDTTKTGKICWYKNVNGYLIGPVSGNTSEENQGTATFSIALDTCPKTKKTDTNPAKVSIRVSSSKTDEGVVSPASLDFTASDWDNPKIITITGVDDTEADGDVKYKIILDAVESNDPNYDKTDPDDIELSNIDNDEDFQTDSPGAANTGNGSAGGCYLESLSAR